MIYHTNKYFKMQHHTVTKFYKTVDIRRKSNSNNTNVNKRNQGELDLGTLYGLIHYSTVMSKRTYPEILKSD